MGWLLIQWGQNIVFDAYPADNYYLLDKLDKLAEELRQTRALVKFLAKTYGDNDPIFYFNDLYGHELVENKELSDTWHRVVRGRNPNQIGLGLDSEAGNTGPTAREENTP
jgi:hypothetical protein